MSGWTAATVEPADTLSPAAHESAMEQIESALEEHYGEDAGGYAETTVQLPRNCDHDTEAERLFDRVPQAKYVTIVSANDTSDSGYGNTYTIEDGDVVHVDRCEGYEGARGRDVTGYFSDEHGRRSYASWEA